MPRGMRQAGIKITIDGEKELTAQIKNLRTQYQSFTSEIDKNEAEFAGRGISYCATCDGALYKGKKVVVVGHGNSAKHEVKYLEGICARVYNIHHDEPIPEDAEAVFVAIGRVPNTSMFEDLVSIDSEGYIVADESCKTSAPGIFVAGDVRTKDLRQLVTAASDGSIAAMEAVKYLG